ncbi:MAG: glycosyltransferase, partial [Xanthomonadaceae bacterium]|nr:glycosyltransferase [Xanthomonadaceae bacterium]
VSVLIPARNEANSITRTLASLAGQPGIKQIIVVDDRSTDQTAALARRVEHVCVIDGKPAPAGWSGKLWALQQGLARVHSPLVLLLDADIRLAPGMLKALVDKLRKDGLDQVSIMASLPAESPPEKLLLPAYVFFFKLLYPFSWVNRDDRPFAAAAGGCILVRRDTLLRSGAFEAWKGALIDDCELARRIRAAGGRLWLGLSHGVRSLRRHPDLRSLLEGVSRTAYPQLCYSPLWLALVTGLMLLAFLVPPAAVAVGVIAGHTWLFCAGLAAWLAMATAYAPQVRFSGLPTGWALTLPFAAMLFLWSTWVSAWLHYSGTGAGWKGRRYPG